jgi:hypothetical protein
MSAWIGRAGRASHEQGVAVTRLDGLAAIVNHCCCVLCRLQAGGRGRTAGVRMRE